MKNKEKFIAALSTLFHSWGSDTPEEVLWGCNELLDWFEEEYSVKLGVRFEGADPGCSNYEEVEEAIRKS